MNKHQAIDPAGKVHTRNSASRIYTHTVVAQRNYEREMAGSCDGWRINPRILEATMTSTKKKA